MAPTARAAVLFAVGVLWLIPAWLDARAVALMIVWNVLVAAAIAIDVARLPRPAALRLTRRWHGPLTLGAPGMVSLELENGGRTPIVARVTDYLSGGGVRVESYLAVLVAVDYPGDAGERPLALEVFQNARR